jgi:hypothetical protein
VFLLPSAIGAIQQDPIRRIFKQASLDLQFAEKKSLVDATTGSNLVTFTRASSGTFVGSDGLIRTAVTNLFVRSEEFDNATWVKTRASVSANSAVAPNGTATADKLIANTDNNTHLARQVFTSVAQTYTASCYCKAAEYSAFTFFCADGNATTFRSIGVDLAAQTLTALNTGMAGSQSITAVGDGWYRVVVTFTVTNAGAISYVDFRLASGTPTTSGQQFAGNDVDGLLFWGAQLEQSSTVGEYIPTTSTINSAPRFDHNPTTGESLGLLVEEQRTNLLLQSEDFSTSWTTVTATVTTNVATAPDGTTTADSYSGTSTSAVNQSISLTSGVTYTISFYVKSAGLGNDSFRLRIDTTQSSSNFTATSEWQRFSFTATSANTGARVCGILRNLASNDVDILIWGAQLEVGAFPTSYIPTTTATVTRSADVASISGSNFSSWYRQDEGTVFADAQTASASANGITSLNDGTNNEAINLYRTATSAVFQVRDDNVTQAFISGTVPAGFKMSCGIGANNFAAFGNAVSLGVDTFGTLPTVDRLNVGSLSAGNLINGTIRRLTYWPTRLPNSTLQAVTQ